MELAVWQAKVTFGDVAWQKLLECGPSTRPLYLAFGVTAVNDSCFQTLPSRRKLLRDCYALGTHIIARTRIESASCAFAFRVGRIGSSNCVLFYVIIASKERKEKMEIELEFEMLDSLITVDPRHLTCVHLRTRPLPFYFFLFYVKYFYSWFPSTSKQDKKLTSGAPSCVGRIVRVVRDAPQARDYGSIRIEIWTLVHSVKWCAQLDLV